MATLSDKEDIEMEEGSDNSTKGYDTNSNYVPETMVIQTAPGQLGQLKPTHTSETTTQMRGGHTARTLDGVEKLMER